MTGAIPTKQMMSKSYSTLCRERWRVHFTFAIRGTVQLRIVHVFNYQKTFTKTDQYSLVSVSFYKTFKNLNFIFSIIFKNFLSKNPSLKTFSRKYIINNSIFFIIYTILNIIYRQLHNILLFKLNI